MFSSAFVCLLAGLSKNYSTDFHKNRWKGGTWTTEENITFWWKSGSRNVKVKIRVTDR